MTFLLHQTMSSTDILDQELPREFFPATAKAILEVGREVPIIRYKFNQFTSQKRSDEVLIMLLNNGFSSSAKVVPNEDHYLVHKRSIDAGYVLSCDYYFVPKDKIMQKVTMTKTVDASRNIAISHLETDA